MDEILKPISPLSLRKSKSKEEIDRKDSLKDLIIYINQQLDFYGYPAPLNFFDSKDDNSVRKIVDCIFSLLRDHQKEFEVREELDDKHRRLQSDYDIACLSNKGLKNKIENNEREIDNLSLRIIRIENELKSEWEMHKLTKDELAKTKLNLQYIKTQAAHEVKKREVEYARFKEKMQKLLNDNYRKANIGLQMVNPAPKSSKRHSDTSIIEHGLPIKTGTSVAEEEEIPDAEMFKQIVADAEAREKELLQENSKLRKLLFDVQNHISTFIESRSEHEASIDPELINLRTPDSYNPKAARFKLPFEMFANNVEEEIKDLLLALKHEWDNRPNMIVEYEAKEEENRQLQTEYEAKEEENRQLQSEYEAKNRKLRAEYEAKNRKLQTEYKAKEEENRQLQSEYEAKEEENRQLQSEYEAKNRKLRAEYEAKNRKLQTEYKAKEEENRQLQSEYEAKNRKLRAEYEAKNRKLQTEYKAKEEENRQLQSEYEAKEEENRQLQSEYEAKEEENRQLQTEYEAQEEENRQLQLEIDSLGNQLAEAATFVEEAQKMIVNFAESGFKEGQGEFKLNVSGNEITIPEYDELDEDIQLKRRQLNQERRAFTESLIRLGKDRDQLLKERIEFEREKRAWKALHPTPGSRKSRANILSSFLEETPTPPQKFTIPQESPLTPFLEQFKSDFELPKFKN
ncbi:afadin- and alpha-actinin-binding protein isoform X1 [Rhizophagus clarus]|uniref:Afadin-and alpha-actinin-binding protein isoform X1 n=1 Tax=Rhizophagus clarus TaxID=94130 RepID=A0A8H3M7V1_9GLOM|nr:afadin- and alpha-actinin-binding protein isoform X1 [Rhizophagus clarus]